MKKNYTQGFIALTTALVLSAVFLSVGISAARLAVSGGQETTSAYSSDKAQIMAESCAEYALFQLQESVDYLGGETIQIGNETCDILLVGGSGNTDRVIQVESTVSEFTRHVEVVVAVVFPEIKISSFMTVVDF